MMYSTGSPGCVPVELCVLSANRIAQNIKRVDWPHRLLAPLVHAETRRAPGRVSELVLLCGMRYEIILTPREAGWDVLNAQFL